MKLRKMGSILGSATLSLLLWGSLLPARAEMTPPILINGNGVLAEAPKRGKVELTYDVRPISAKGLEVYIEELPRDPNNSKPAQTVRFTETHGKVPLDFYNREAGIYLVSARALDDEGKPFADMSRAVHLRYGGGRAMKNYDKRCLEINGVPENTKVFSEIIPYDILPKAAMAIKPQVTVIKPGEKARLSFKFALDNAKDKELVDKIAKDYDTQVYWRLQGEGKLITISPTEVLYESPAEGNHTVKVMVKMLDRVSEATIYVTDMKIGECLNSGM